jgi:hypothetical protein
MFLLKQDLCHSILPCCTGGFAGVGDWPSAPLLCLSQ